MTKKSYVQPMKAERKLRVTSILAGSTNIPGGPIQGGGENPLPEPQTGTATEKLTKKTFTAW